VKALVTGAAGGIGSAVAEAFEKSGHGVLRQDLRAPDDGSEDFVVGNLADDGVLAELTRRVREEQVDCVVAAHGVAGAVDLRSISAEQTRFVMTANTVSVLRLYEAVAPVLRERSGAFVMVASQAGLVGEANNGVYCASKLALVGWARALARTDGGAAPRLRVLCPGATETRLLVEAFQGMADSAGKSYEEILGAREAAIPGGRLGRPAELGAAAVWLAGLTTPSCIVAAVTGGEVLH
jgi:NAD(P)-dependent dehydrogenase (short-subunit alcohol dehydrogenase family)